MEIFLKIIIDLLNTIFVLLKNPYFVLLIAICISLKLIYPKIRGYMGEFWVKLELKKLSKKNYIVLNDIMIEDENGTHQIDHLVISDFGIFVIEMKNYFGLIVGNEFQDKWTQYLGRKKYYFKNPVYQNYGHIKSLEKLLKLENSNFISIICFSNDVKLNVKSRIIITQLDNLTKHIKDFYKPLLNNINEIADVIVKSNIIDKEKRKNHVKEIKNKIKTDKEKVDNMICPKCGNQLVLKNSKYGTFVGCSNYPKCKYIKK